LETTVSHQKVEILQKLTFFYFVKALSISEDESDMITIVPSNIKVPSLLQVRFLLNKIKKIV